MITESNTAERTVGAALCGRPRLNVYLAKGATRMHKKTFLALTLAVLVFIQIPGNETVHSQGRPTVTPEMLEKRRAIESELQSIAIVERKLMIPMRDGKRIATDVYRPKDTSKKYPTIFVRTPYNFN